MEKELLTSMTLTGWQSLNKRIEKLVDGLTDEQLQAEVAPGRNRGIYLLGHMATVSDMMLPLLGLGTALKPEYQAIFVSSPDKAVKELPSATEVKSYLKEVNATLNGHFAKMNADDWFKKHTQVSDEDFAKEPHRNRLNIILSRTGHHNYHLGQMAFLQPKA
jgi:hypothetical protein